MKQWTIILSCLFFCTVASAQSQPEEEAERKGFKKELLFSGGSISLYFFNNISVLGASPHLGYSIAKWLDAAVSMNVNYISQRNYFSDNDKVRQVIYAPGAFVRLYPFHFLSPRNIFIPPVPMRPMKK
jgi:hypothetical protein